MAGVSGAYAAMVTEALGFMPDGLSKVISALTAEQRDRFTLAWLTAAEDQRSQPASTWVLPPEDRATFEVFRTGMSGLVTS